MLSASRASPIDAVATLAAVASHFAVYGRGVTTAGLERFLDTASARYHLTQLRHAGRVRRVADGWVPTERGLRHLNHLRGIEHAA